MTAEVDPAAVSDESTNGVRRDNGVHCSVWMNGVGWWYAKKQLFDPGFSMHDRVGHATVNRPTQITTASNQYTPLFLTFPIQFDIARPDMDWTGLDMSANGNMRQTGALDRSCHVVAHQCYQPTRWMGSWTFTVRLPRVTSFPSQHLALPFPPRYA